MVRKDIRNLHLAVYPPDGWVRVAAPRMVSDDAVRLAVIDKLGWIKRQRAMFQTQHRQSEREFTDGESHYFFGQRYRLSVIEGPGRASVSLPTTTRMELRVPEGATLEQRRAVLDRWYRRELAALVPQLLETWEEQLGVSVESWGIRRMKTKWGTCNPSSKRVVLNLELAKKPRVCAEYIVVHELVHLMESSHGDRFTAAMDEHLPMWRTYRDQLNDAPLAHERWDY